MCLFYNIMKQMARMHFFVIELPFGINCGNIEENDRINFKNSSIHKLYNILRHIKNGTKSFSLQKYYKKAIS